jgi:hypothetical protein
VIERRRDIDALARATGDGDAVEAEDGAGGLASRAEVGSAAEGVLPGEGAATGATRQRLRVHGQLQVG